MIIIGKQRIYNSVYENKGITNVIKWEVIPIAPNEELRIRILSTNSNNIQGLRIAAEKNYILKLGTERKNDYWIWENNVGSREIVFTTEKTTNVSIYNVCQTPSSDFSPYGEVLSQMDYSGMIVEKKDENTCIYRCNDLRFSIEFCSLVFELKVTKKICND